MGCEGFWVRIWIVIASAVVLIVLIAGIWDCYTTKLYTDKGYEQIQVVGSSIYKWQKK